MLFFYLLRKFNLYSNKLNIIIAYLVIITSIIMIYKYKDSLPLFLMSFFIGYSNYSIAYIVYIKQSPPSILYNQITDINVYGIAISAILLFNIVLITSNYLNSSKVKIVAHYSENIILCICLIFFLVLIFIFSYDRSGISSVRSSSTPVYEYSLILFILLFYYGSKNLIIRFCYTLILVIFSFQSFFTGNRVEAISFIFAFIIYHYSNKLNYKQLLPLLIIGIIFMSMIGEFRSEMTLSFSAISSTLINMLNNGLTFNTAYWAFFPSLSIIEMSDRINFIEKLYLFGQSIKYIFLGSSVPDSSLIIYAKKYYVHSMGNISIIYFYFWFKEIGFIFFSFLSTMYIRLHKYMDNRYINDYKAKYLYLLFVYFISTTPRWYLYSPFPLLRGVLIFSVCYLIFEFFDRLIKSKMKC